MTHWVTAGRFSLLFIILLAGSAQAQEELPFWRVKPKLWQQISEQRRVVVSVDVEKENKQEKVRILGVGVVNVPLYFAEAQIQKFEQLPEVSGYFKRVKHDPDKKQVYIHAKALGTQVRFLQQYQWGKRTPSSVQMDWKVIWGRLEGMVGHYQLRRVSPTKTEIAIWASLSKEVLPIPQFLLNFTLEVIAEKTAQKMRAFIENQFHSSQTGPENYVEKR